MTTLHRPPTALDLICDAQQLHQEPLTWEQAERRAAQAKAAYEARIDDLRDKLSHAESMAAASYGDVSRFAVWTAAANDLRARLAEVEG